jgi:hypothetical protein
MNKEAWWKRLLKGGREHPQAPQAPYTAGQAMSPDEGKEAPRIKDTPLLPSRCKVAKYAANFTPPLHPFPTETAAESEGSRRLLLITATEEEARATAAERLEPKDASVSRRRNHDIIDMCLTVNPTYGVDTDCDEVQGLYDQMAKIYDSRVAPILDDLERQKEKVSALQKDNIRLNGAKIAHSPEFMLIRTAEYNRLRAIERKTPDFAARGVLLSEQFPPKVTEEMRQEREKIIVEMCATFNSVPASALCDKKHFLAVVYDQHIAQIVKERDCARQELRDNEIVGFDSHPLGWWRKLRMQAHSDQEQLKLIDAALRRAGLDERGAPAHATVCLLATNYLRLMEGKVPEGMVAADRNRIEQLLEIERGHKDEQRRLVQLHMDFNQQIARSLGLKPGTPVEVILDKLQMVQRQAECYRGEHREYLGIRDRVISDPNMTVF